MFCFILTSSVIVSQWTSMLQIVAWHLKKRGLTYATINGSVRPKQRMDLVEAFNSSRSPQVGAGPLRALSLRAHGSQLHSENSRVAAQHENICCLGPSTCF